MNFLSLQCHSIPCLSQQMMIYNPPVLIMIPHYNLLSKVGHSPTVLEITEEPMPRMKSARPTAFPAPGAGGPGPHRSRDGGHYVLSHPFWLLLPSQPCLQEPQCSHTPPYDPEPHSSGTHRGWMVNTEFPVYYLICRGALQEMPK